MFSLFSQRVRYKLIHALSLTTNRMLAQTDRFVVPRIWTEGTTQIQDHGYSTSQHANTRSVACHQDRNAEAARYHCSQCRAKGRQMMKRELSGMVLEKQAQDCSKVDSGSMRETVGKAAEERREVGQKRGRPYMRRNLQGWGR